MDFYTMLEKLVKNSTMREEEKQASREIIKSLRSINAFGSIIAGMESDTIVEPHTHFPETRWYKFDPNKLVDVCKECETIVKGPYSPNWERKNW